MWYQRLSARSMPPASVPSVGTIHAATTTATAPAASQTATRDDSGAGGVTAATRPPPLLPAQLATAATATAPSIIVHTSNAANVPNASATPISSAIATTASTTRAGAPNHPEKNALRTCHAANAKPPRISASSKQPTR